MTPKSHAETLITVFGGSGFLGRHVVQALAERQYRVRVAVRRPDLTGHLQPLGCVGQIHAVQANVRNRPSVAAAVRGSDVVINLVGLLGYYALVAMTLNTFGMRAEGQTTLPFPE